jgi:hypothetical protein
MVNLIFKFHIFDVVWSVKRDALVVRDAAVFNCDEFVDLKTLATRSLSPKSDIDGC